MRRVLETGMPVIDLDVEGQTPAAPGQTGTGRRASIRSRATTPSPSAWRRLVEVTGEREARPAQQMASALLDAVFGAAPSGSRSTTSTCGSAASTPRSRR